MALHPNQHLTPHQTLSLLDCLYCEEESWEEEDREIPVPDSIAVIGEDEELDSLFSKEQENRRNSVLVEANGAPSPARAEAVEWMLKVIAHYEFSSLTALLAINYLDRVLCLPHFQVEKPWTVQLLAVTCVSLAAKVEEIQVPLLLDLQVEDTKYIFEAKTIQRMELLVLTSLRWKMHPVTSVSFLDLIVRRLGFKSHIRMEFFRRCERLLLSLVSDSRSVGFLPSELAISSMVSIIEQMGNHDPSELQDRVLNALNISKGRVKECCNLIEELTKSNAKTEKSHGKRKQEVRSEVESSPSGVVDAIFSCESSNDSWGMGISPSAAADCDYSPPSKRSRAGEQPMSLPSLLNRVFVDFVANSP